MVKSAAHEHRDHAPRFLNLAGIGLSEARSNNPEPGGAQTMDSVRRPG